MKTESRLFGMITACLWVFAAVYGWWTWHDSGGSHGGKIEFIGFVALILAGLLCGMCWGFFSFVARRLDPRPEDRPDGEIADAAGEVGFFSPGSYWPFGIALSATIAGLGLVFWMVWLLAVGLLAVLVTTCGLTFEYYTSTRKASE
ncbi:MAG TPA: cytochrome c oxidase subunit 4 [Stackebrandtia sp.]|jgi:fatty acid desaturase|uniref:cytochrome c oxidase subunit 4 n=1 Tax=Stackebrandtia sp. TaxID=2023065 RepID=UPI002D333512|nr:cytochrome c oxidase subunit 4 [Stackebrandtia sp.]HZE39748.1 cytochrome c oxidase subunit 4 [Stackebrandtia sp.]